MSQKIRIKLKSYDHTLVEKSAEKIVKNVKATGAVVSGPIPLPTRKRIIIIDGDNLEFGENPEDFRKVTDLIDAELFGLF